MGRSDSEGNWRRGCQREVISYLSTPSVLTPSRNSTLITRIKEICNFPTEAESNRIISGLRWIGLLSSTPLNPRAGNLLDTLCAQLETLNRAGFLQGAFLVVASLNNVKKLIDMKHRRRLRKAS